MSRLLVGIVAIVALGGAAGRAAASKSDRACLAACKATRGKCLRIAKRQSVAAMAGCTGDRRTHRTCVHGVRRAFQTGRAACRTLLADCRACCRAGGQGPRCPVGQPIDFTPPPEPDLTQLGLPTAPSGRPILLSVPGAQLEFDMTRRDALTALGACTNWITACAVGGQAVDDCVRSVPPCGTDAPWQEPVACCAPSCFARYQQARRAGTEAPDAVDTVYYGDDPCMPGVGDLLRTGRQ
jgi:hypothetical protein